MLVSSTQQACCCHLDLGRQCISCMSGHGCVLLPTAKAPLCCRMPTAFQLTHSTAGKCKLAVQFFTAINVRNHCLVLLVWAARRLAFFGVAHTDPARGVCMCGVQWLHRAVPMPLRMQPMPMHIGMWCFCMSALAECIGPVLHILCRVQELVGRQLPDSRATSMLPVSFSSEMWSVNSDQMQWQRGSSAMLAMLPCCLH